MVELAIRITAYGSRPQDFFKDGWNVFDFVVIGPAFLPGVRDNVTLLRLARLLRVVRLVSVMPDLRVLVRAMARSIPPITSLALLTLLLMYVYGMVGWILFHDEDPEQWGNIGQAMLSLFQILTLENWPQYLDAGQAIHPASWIFFVSYVLIASFLVINILIAIIINSMEEVHDARARGPSARPRRGDRGRGRARSPTACGRSARRSTSSRPSSPRGDRGASALARPARARAGGCAAEHALRGCRVAGVRGGRRRDSSARHVGLEVGDLAAQVVDVVLDDLELGLGGALAGGDRADPALERVDPVAELGRSSSAACETSWVEAETWSRERSTSALVALSSLALIASTTPTIPAASASTIASAAGEAADAELAVDLGDPGAQALDLLGRSSAAAAARLRRRSPASRPGSSAWVWPGGRFGLSGFHRAES